MMKQAIVLIAFVCLAQLAWSFEEKTTQNAVSVDVEDPYGGGGGGGSKMGGGKMGGGKMGGGKQPGGKMGGSMGGGNMGGSMGGGKMGGGKAPGAGKMGGKPKAPAGGKMPTGKMNTAGKMPTGGKHTSTGAAHGSTGVAQPAPVTSGDGRRDQLVACGKALYDNRDREHYTEGGSRWDGITNKVRPPSAPTYSDCSSAVSWCYWTVFGNGPDILNGADWKGGYTGTMASHGSVIACSQMQPGDVALYGSGSSWEHAEMYMGGGYMVSHGKDPVSYPSSTSLQGFARMECRRYF